MPVDSKLNACNPCDGYSYGLQAPYKSSLGNEFGRAAHRHLHVVEEPMGQELLGNREHPKNILDMFSLSGKGQTLGVLSVPAGHIL